MKKVSVAILMVFCLFFSAYGQKSAVKLGLGGLATASVNGRFEVALADRVSFQLTGMYKFPTNPLKGLTQELNMTTKGLSGFGVIPEVRFYFGQSLAGTIEGFYLAPFLKYHRYGIDGSQVINYTNDKGTIILTPDFDISLATVGGGLQLGYHFIFGKHFSLDWHFLGFGVDFHRARARYDFANSDVNLLDVAQQVIDNINETLEEDYPINAQDFEPFIDGNRARFAAPFTLPGFRAGISIGMAF